MDKTRKIITDNEENFGDFIYYLDILDKIEENIQKMPDIAIESCKSLVEGVSKTILNTLGKQYIEKGRNSDTPDNLIRKAIDELSVYTSIDLIFAQNACGLIKRTSEIRNERGDISHGKSAPKNISSDTCLSEMIAHTTDGIVYYILSIFFSTKLPDFSEIKYEDNNEFNEFLDNGNEADSIIYSKALFDQDCISYKEQLKNYLSEIEENDGEI